MSAAKKDKNRVCPVERAGSLDNWLRRWQQNPRKLLGSYITRGMTVMDMGCGPGFFTLAMAHMVGDSGRIIAVDLQEGMLDIVRKKIAGTDLESRITLYQCGKTSLGLRDSLDFILAFYVMHELPDQAAFFNEIAGLIRNDGLVYIVEPPFHVSKKGFKAMIECARRAGFVVDKLPRFLFSKAVILKKTGHVI